MLTIPHLFEMLEAAALTSSNVFLLRMFGSTVSGANDWARCASLPRESDATNASSTTTARRARCAHVRGVSLRRSGAA